MRQHTNRIANLCMTGHRDFDRLPVANVSIKPDSVDETVLREQPLVLKCFSILSIHSKTRWGEVQVQASC